MRKIYRQYTSERKNYFALGIVYSLIFATSCSGLSKAYKGDQDKALSEKLAREDFIVLNRSQEKRPLWISHPQKFGNKKGDGNGRLYFSFETTPKIEKEMACNIARAYAREDLSRFFITFFTKGEEHRVWNEFLSNKGHEFLRDFLKSSRLIRTYWEQRRYRNEFDESQSSSYTCALLINIKEEEFKHAMLELQNRVIKSLGFKKPQDIQRVQKALDAESFLLFYKMNF